MSPIRDMVDVACNRQAMAFMFRFVVMEAFASSNRVLVTQEHRALAG